MNKKDLIKNLYIDFDYIIKNPSLHEEDSPWKVRQLLPVVDILMKKIHVKEINLLDVGGGAGLILKSLVDYMKDEYDLKINKFALDISPKMLEIQMENNYDLKKPLNEDIGETTLNDEEIDITLMIDVLEHVFDQEKTLIELKRISNFIIYKVPLEKNLIFRIWNFLTRNKWKKNQIETLGHLHFYNFKKLKCLIEKFNGQILCYYFPNRFTYYLKSNHYRNKNFKIKFRNTVGNYVFKISPKISSIIFGGDIILLVKCY